MPPVPRRRPQRGFTIIELLVVIAIIAVLAAILFPVFAKAREKARQASCASNLKQISQAMQMYTSDNDNRFPPSWAAAGGNNIGERWPLILFPYTRNIQVYDCPTSTATVGTVLPDALIDDDPDTWGGYEGNYGVNYDGIVYGAESMATAVQAPAETFMFLDAAKILACCWGTNNWAQFMDHLGLDEDTGLNRANRHNGMVNVSFMDGHVKSLPLTEVVKRNGDYVPPWDLSWDDNPPADDGPIPFPGT